ncbi:MAG: ABC transporter ATP-binding protein, partial [Candidatus Korarchaeum sp.]|nr:ABC transporter ATP-binding protein [Candidatus Korarchaeum sp.]
ASTEELFESPLHPYTRGLLRAIPNPEGQEGKLFSMEGEIPSLINPPSGCLFHPRCPHRMSICEREVPRLLEVSEGHEVACFLYGS